MSTKRICGGCNGGGQVSHPCHVCIKAGRVVVNGQMQTCPQCGGVGRLVLTCVGCKGNGYC